MTKTAKSSVAQTELALCDPSSLRPGIHGGQGTEAQKFQGMVGLSFVHPANFIANFASSSRFPQESIFWSALMAIFTMGGIKSLCNGCSRSFSSITRVFVVSLSGYLFKSHSFRRSICDCRPVKPVFISQNIATQLGDHYAIR